MRNVNTLSPKYYFFISVVGMLWGMLVYRPTVFSCLFFTSYNESMAILCAVCGVCFVATYLMTFRRRRNYASVITNSVLPFGIYTVFAYEEMHYTFLGVISVAAIAVGLAYCLAVMGRSVRPDRMDEILNVFRNRIYHCIVGAKSIAAVGLAVFVGYIYILNVFGIPSVVPAVEPIKAVEENKQEYLMENMEAISAIDDSKWVNLSADERLDVMQTLANVEKVQQGISHEILVCAEPLGFSTYGYYDDSTHTVTLNTNIIHKNSAEESVETLCHEVRHAYQHDVANAYLSLDKDYQQLGFFDEVRKYYENLDDYQQVSKDGFDAYENQTVEVDSRNYSEKQTEFYFEKVETYLNQKN